MGFDIEALSLSVVESARAGVTLHSVEKLGGSIKTYLVNTGPPTSVVNEVVMSLIHIILLPTKAPSNPAYPCNLSILPVVDIPPSYITP